MQNIEEFQKGLLKPLAQKELNKLITDGKIEEWSASFGSETLEGLVILTIYNEIQKPITYYQELSNIMKSNDIRAMRRKLLSLSDDVHNLETELYSAHRAIFSSDKDKLVNDTIDNFYANVPNEKINLLETIEEVVSEARVVK